MLMKKNILLYMAAVAGLVLAGCNKEIVPPQEGSLDMTVTASIGDLTKVAYDGASTTFQTGDKIAVWGWTGAPDALPQVFAVDGIVNTLKESGKWEPAKQMLWKNVTDKHYFMAVHPVPEAPIEYYATVPYAVDNTNYEASDLLLATNLEGLTASSKTVNLTFTHAMAKLQVNLNFRSQFGPDGPNPEIVAAVLVGKSTAKVNYLTKAVTPTGSDGPVGMVPAATATGYDMSFSGIQIPQEATKIVVAVGEITYSYTHPEPLPLVPGKVTTLGFNVGQDVILLDKVTVTDWVSDEPITGGEAELETEVDLSELTADYVARGRVVLRGDLIAPVKISVADGATVTLDGVTIEGVNDENYKWAGITCEGDATIILKEGSTNTVMGFHETAPGIFIPEDKTLIIKGEGSLTASTYIADPSDINSYGFGAGIGGGRDVSCGNIEIQGGNIVAIGGMFAAGIGTAGIENENFTNCGTIKISGGSVVATSQYFGAGIGCGYSGICDSITISGGTVEATGGYAGPGIGSTVGDSSCGDIIISGGTVTATTSNASPGIGSSNEPSVCGNITISGGTVTAIGKEFSPGIGAGGSWNTGGSCGNITITSGVTKVTAIKGTKPEATNSIGAGLNAISCGTVTIGGMETGSISTSPYMYPIDLSKVTSDLVAGNGARMFETLAGNYKISIDDGATVILDNATIQYSSNGADWAGLTLLGDGTIQLANGSTNTAIGGLDNDGYSNCPGIFVPEGKTLTINGNTGVLIAACGDGNPDGQGAGIGASWYTNCGNIVINGGVISATGGNRGAGIGGSGRRNCGYITINGGTVTATGHEGAPGIGIGGAKKSDYEDGGTCGDITITGGTVIATGGKWGAGIGTGNAFNSKEVTVTKTCGNILISGGTVTATGGEHAAGIGSGEAEDGKGIINIGTITITDGVTLLTATKGSGAPNSIGKGTGTNVTCGTVTIGGVEGVISASPYIYPNPFADVTAAAMGKVIGADGVIYDSASDATTAGTTAVAIVAYVGEPGSVDASGSYKGLAIAMTDASSDMCQWYDVEKDYIYCVSMSNAIGTAIGFKNGIECTNTLVNSNGTGVTSNCSGHNHAAATLAVSNNGTAAPVGTSGWFLPSMGQWNLIVQGLATVKAGEPVTTNLVKTSGNTNIDSYMSVSLNDVITAAGGTGFVKEGRADYWSSTMYIGVEAWVMRFGRGSALDWEIFKTACVRSVLAF